MPTFEVIARWLMLIGAGLLAIGGLVLLLGRLGLPLGSLPGDFRLSRGSFTCLVPLASGVVLSLLLTLLLNLALRVLNR